MELILPPSNFWEVFKKTNGALSSCESIAIMNIAAQAPIGNYIELGVFHGKSAMSALVSLKDYDNTKFVRFILVDPIFNDKDICEMVMKNFNDTGIHKNMSYEFNSTTSLEEIPKYDKYSYVFIDSGSHQDGLPMAEAILLEERLLPGGIIAWHDWNSQFKEVKEASDYLVSTGKFEYIDIPWNKIIDYVRANDLEKGNQSWHHTEMEFPNFVGAVKRK